MLIWIIRLTYHELVHVLTGSLAQSRPQIVSSGVAWKKKSVKSPPGELELNVLPYA